MVERKIPRIQEIVLDPLRNALPGVTVASWIPHIDQREYPLLIVRRIGGLPVDVEFLDRHVIELTAYTRDGLVSAENLFMDARQVLFNMVQDQTVTTAGSLHSFFDTMGMTQFDSTFEDSWRIQGLIQLGVRPPRA